MLLRERILAGIYPPGSALPSEHELMRSFDISRITAKRALDELLAEGLVDRSRGRGTIVRPNVLAHPFISADINDLMKSLNEIGRTTSVKVIEFGYQAASPRVASELGIDPGTTIQRAVRVRYLDEVPFSHSSSHLIEHVGRTFTKAKLASLPLIELLSMAGIRIGHVRQGITATLADEILAKRLQVSVASPLLKVRRVFFDSNQRPVNYAEMLYCPDRFEYSMSLTLAARQQPARIASQPGRARRNGG